MTGDDSLLTLEVDGDQVELDVYNFVRNVDHTVVKCFASRDIVTQCLVAKQISADLSFSGQQVCMGEIIAVGFEVTSFGDSGRDGIILHIKHDI